jgi:protein-S-isoprenylcysteine O-methyltransferase Ste14
MAARAFAWVGGALFVIALITCTGWYLLVLGRPSATVDARAAAIDTAIFSVFAAHHSLFAREPVKRLFGSLDAQTVRSIYVWIASLLLIAVCVVWQPIGGDLYRASGFAGLQRSGVYGWVRHPIYLGWVLAVFATPHLTGDRLAFAVVSTLYLAAAVPFEERSLRRTFGEEYARYARTVKWRIVPFIY